MINPAVLCVPAMVANQTIRRQQSSDIPVRCSYPTFDRGDRKRFVDRYVEELKKEGFEVFSIEDVVNDRIIVKVRKENIMYCESVGIIDFMDDVYMDFILRRLVRNVENAFKEAEKENNNA